MAERLEITLLGGVAIMRGDKPVTGLGTRKAEALRLTEEMQAERLTWELLTAVAHLAHLEGDDQRAIKTAAFILTQPNVDQELASEANALLAQASAALSPKDVATSRQEGEAMTLSGQIQQLQNEILSGS